MQQPRRRPLESESGFTLVEFMIASLIATIVLGSTVALATQIQQSYSTQLDDAAVEQEARYALDWIARDLRAGGSDPYDIVTPDDQEIWLDPNGGGDDNDSIRLQSDVNPPNGVLDGDGENVTIAFDSANNVITRLDANADDPAAVAMTDAIFTDLSFTFLNAAHAETATSSLITYVRVEVTAQSRAINPNTQEFTTSTLVTEVRLRTR